VQNNSAVRVDIEKYSTPQNRVEFEQWMKEQLLWTALSKYESYIFFTNNKRFPTRAIINAGFVA